MIEPGSVIGRYRVQNRLGAGGMADVYHAEDTVMGRAVALKVLPPEFARDGERVARFEKEVRHLASLDHSHIVTIHDVGHESGYNYYAMALLPGGNLKDRIRKGLDPGTALSILRAMADALRYAHSRGLVHRDIKPENILFRADGTPVLTDLGIARAIGAGTQITRTGMSIGTPHYMSPEQTRGKDVDGRSDIYSLGVVMFEMLTGKAPYHAEDTIAVALMHVSDPVPELPEELLQYQPLIDRMMAKDPDDRFTCASDLIQAINALQAGEKLDRPSATRVMSRPEPRRPEPVRKRSSFAWAAGGALLALVIVAGFYWYQSGSPVSVSPGSGGTVLPPVVSAPVEPPVSPAPPPEEERLVREKAEAEQRAREAAEADRRSHITELLSAADADIRANRLTLPDDNNALDKYLQVLDLDEANQEARRGLERIVARYIELIDGAIAAGDYPRARRHLDAAHGILPNEPLLAEADERLVASERLAREQAESRRRARYAEHMMEGRTALTANERERAIKAFQAALALYKDDSAAKQGLAQARATPDRLPSLTNSLGIEFVWIPPGEYWRGTSDLGNESPRHQVILTEGFYLQTTEVTQGQWRAVMGNNPSRFTDCGDNCPVERVSWNDAQNFIRKLNSMDSRFRYRLPTEAEWEYAARAGSTTRFHFGDDESRLGDYAWYEANSGGRTHPVATKLPNAWGLYDMHGNVWEWVSDCYWDYPSGHVTNPSVSSSFSGRVHRGGGWNYDARYCRSATRFSLPPGYGGSNMGFRLAADPR